MKSNQQKQTALAIAAALATAWIATGNAGLLSHPVRHLLALLGAATVATLVAANPKRREAAPLLRSTAVAIGCFMLYRVLLFSVPPVWTAANTVAHVLGGIGGAVGGQRLRVGPTFAGIDFLVLMASWLAICLAHTPRASACITHAACRRRPRCVTAHALRSTAPSAAHRYRKAASSRPAPGDSGFANSGY